MTENIEDFISFHNAHVIDEKLTATLETVSAFASNKHILLEDLSVEKHRLPYINWMTSLVSSQV